MELKEFVKILKENVHRFEIEWIEGNEKNPEDYPMELPFSDWWEQFEMDFD
jgi:hypothetical protein